MSFDWVSTAVLGAAVLGLVNIIDSHLLCKRMQKNAKLADFPTANSRYLFNIWFGIIHSVSFN